MGVAAKMQPVINKPQTRFVQKAVSKCTSLASFNCTRAALKPRSPIIARNITIVSTHSKWPSLSIGSSQ